MIGVYKELDTNYIKSGIISLKNIKEGVLEGVFEGKNSLSIENIKTYEKEIISLINEILNQKIEFKN